MFLKIATTCSKIFPKIKIPGLRVSEAACSRSAFKVFLAPGCREPKRVHKHKPYLEGHGDLVNGLIMGIIRVTIWIIGVINPLTKST